MSLLPTPRSRDFKRGGKDCLEPALNLLPTPRASDGTHGGPNMRGSRGDLALPSAVVKLLPTPRAANGEDRNSKIWERPLHQPQNLENALARIPDSDGPVQDWDKYTPAIRRQEAVMGRLAPLPTEPAPKGGRRLAPLFTEWLMGEPEGHVTAVPGLSRNQMLRLLGNSVVRMQGSEALRVLKERFDA